MDPKAHWEHVYQTKRADEVSWFQAEPATSLALIRRVAPDRASRIIDVGGGASLLVDRLLADGYTHLSVLDVSATALAVARDRLPVEHRSSVTWIDADVLTAAFTPGSYDVWHDRAVFHFLIELSDRDAYVAQVRRALRPGGHAIIATFAEDGPTKCSGLPVARYSSADLQAVFGAEFHLVESLREQHLTPASAQQSFQYSLLQLRSSPTSYQLPTTG